MSSSEVEISTISPDLDSPPSILDLNDDCLLKILSNLDEVDLCRVNETCERLRQLSEYCFYTRYRCKPFLFQKPNRTKAKKLFEIKRILAHFGNYINKLLIVQYGDWKLIRTYCNQHLQELELNDMYLDRCSVSRSKILLSNVKRLSIKKCRGMYDSARYLDACCSLKELELSEIIDYSGQFLVPLAKSTRFDQLESIIFQKIIFILPNYVTIFFSHNLNLKKLRLIDCHFTSDETLLDISVYLKNIEEISIQIKTFTKYFGENLSRLTKLEKLKRLEFNCAARQITSFVYSLADKNTMDYFSISDTKLNEKLCVALSKMKSLKTLKLISMQDECSNFAKILSTNLINLEHVYVVNSEAFTFSHAFDIIESLPNLTRLVVTKCSQFSTVDFNEFLRLVQARKKWYSVKCLIIYLDQSKLIAVKEAITEKLLQENSGFIKLLSTLRPEIQNEDLICDCDDDDEWTDIEIEYGEEVEDDNESF